MPLKKRCRITILGAGSWGIALANYMGVFHNVKLWEFDPVAAEQLSRTRRREAVLPGAIIPPSVQITNDLGSAVKGSQFIFLVVPSHVVRSVAQQLADCEIDRKTVLISCTKGIESTTCMRISEIIQAETPGFFSDRFAVLSGPSHAEEVSRGIPTAVVVAAEKEAVAKKLQHVLNSSVFRIYRSHDIIGVELGGALKNVIAIAAGICDGAGFGDNTKAALQPRALAEIARLGRYLGADPLTFAGLSGMGDLIVTCMSRHSRNRFVGEEIGKGKKLNEVLSEMTMVAEGVRTCQAAVEMSDKYNVEMPICKQVYQVLFQNKEPKKAMQDLMNRQVKPEVWY
ncbi:NAD(P)-dependent glycerol-3-phosphate dehydrogenase [candidate division KSB1 bacterium]|nr:NAD(P)-dependent glycerol-3-phosphate dehydrogenase [candidate division KSB1 bacterium]